MMRAREGTAIAEVSHGHTVLALIVSHCFHERGIHFFTPGEFSQQTRRRDIVYAPTQGGRARFMATTMHREGPTSGADK
jgi:hypothetical protein